MKEYKEVIFHHDGYKIHLYGHLRAQVIEGDGFFLVQAFDRDEGNYIQHLGIAYGQPSIKCYEGILEVWVDTYQTNILESSWY